MKSLELLAPAKNADTGIFAINCGADAVYIGPPAFGARKSASNTISDIRRLTDYAHRYFCRVFVTVNTVLYENELKPAEHMIWELYESGVDALIIQDMGILKMHLPPIALHASTQMHNYEMDKIRLLEDMGFRRIVLARELSIEQLMRIRENVKAELEVFVHGALCVSMSGRCYMSHYLFNRSANRGECAQPCRQKWTLSDDGGKVILKDKYLLSLKDLNLSAYMETLVRIGIDSFKIEGRLKDRAYVASATGYYSAILDGLPGIVRVGSGRRLETFDFEPERCFSRGFTDYFIEGRTSSMANFETPKSMGRPIGRIKEVNGKSLVITGEEELHNGDGLCGMGEDGLCGMRVNKAFGHMVELNGFTSLKPGSLLYRNYDTDYVNALERENKIRKIALDIFVKAEDRHMVFTARDEDGVEVKFRTEENFEPALRADAKDRMSVQMGKCGDTEFYCRSFSYDGIPLFVPVGRLNDYRRKLLEDMRKKRCLLRPKMKPFELGKKMEFPEKADWRHNVVNSYAEALYRENGCRFVEKGYETGRKSKGQEVMTTKYCILYELGKCLKTVSPEDRRKWRFPLHLSGSGKRFTLCFDCKACMMKILTE